MFGRFLIFPLAKWFPYKKELLIKEGFITSIHALKVMRMIWAIAPAMTFTHFRCFFHIWYFGSTQILTFLDSVCNSPEVQEIKRHYMNCTNCPSLCKILAYTDTITSSHLTMLCFKLRTFNGLPLHVSPLSPGTVVCRNVLAGWTFD